MATKYTFRENVLRVIAVIGLIAVLLLGAWGIIQLAFFIPGFLSDLANGKTSADKTETITLSVPTSVTSGQPFPVSWTHANGSGEYSYALSYSCANGLSAKAPLPTGAGQEVKCNTAFNYINASTTSPLIFTLSAGKQATAVTVKVVATKLANGEVAVSDTADTTVNPSSNTVSKPTTTTTSTKPATTKKPTTTTKPSTTYVASGRTTNLYGLPDLQVRILSNPGTVRAGSQVSLQFEVMNVGTNATPNNWSFTAALPYNPTYTFQSQGQQVLYPGDRIVYTLSYTATPTQNYDYSYGTAYGSGWTNPTDPNAWNYYPYTTGYNSPSYGYQNSTATVSIDPYNLVAESNKYNNTASVSYQVY